MARAMTPKNPSATVGILLIALVGSVAASVLLAQDEEQPNAPKVKVTFGYPLINGAKPKFRYASAYHPTTGSAGSPACAKARAEGDKVVVEVGPIFRRPPSENRYSLKLTP